MDKGKDQNQDNNNNVNFFNKINRIEKSINFIIINSLPSAYKESLFSFFNKLGFSTKGEKYLRNQRHSRFKKFENKDLILFGKSQRVDLYLYPKKYKHTGITIKIYYPTRNLIESLVKFFESIEYPPYLPDDFFPKISFIEYTLDIHTDEPVIIFYKSKQHLHMNNNTSAPFTFYGKSKNTVNQTFYSVKQKEEGSGKKAKNKGMRLYQKLNIPGAPVRMELYMKRKVIRDRKITLHNLVQYMDNLDLSKDFHFKEFKAEKYKNYLLKRESPNQSITGDFKTSRLNPNRNKTRNKIDVKESFISSYIDCHYPENEENRWEPVSQINYDLKSSEKKLAVHHTEIFNNTLLEFKLDPLPVGEFVNTKTIDRFFVKMDDFNDRFFKLVGKGDFLL